ncbi:hypothetical protein [Bosea sp. BH3]|uniref:hypothetical protein n=1 Tax=Bosea sp. BH3 TaxID=2871701 RepID=UPI0021CB5688|nr:hypothetical protein [Bosea sp. BH3]MCU4179537.1 hypothetical protein [Bosea sp. BH3]
MAISPPSDIVLDVVRAADPTRSTTAYDRLARMAMPGSAGAQFANAFTDATTAPGLADARARFASLGPLNPAAAAKATVPPQTEKSLRQFEAQVISTFIEQMMPKSEENKNTYGGGLSGDVWRSQLAEKIAGEISKSGGFGIREKIQAAIVSRAGAVPPGDGTAAAQKVLDRTLAGANSRDAAVPLAAERQFLNIIKPGVAAGALRNSSTPRA